MAMTAENSISKIKKIIVFSNFPKAQYETQFAKKFERMELEVARVVHGGHGTSVDVSSYDAIVALVTLMSSDQRSSLKILAKKYGKRYISLEAKASEWPALLGIDMSTTTPVSIETPEGIVEVNNLRDFQETYEKVVEELEGKLDREMKSSQQALGDVMGERDQLKAHYEELNALHNNLGKEFNTLQDKLKAGGSSSPQELTEAKARVETLQNQLRIYKEMVGSVESTMKTAEGLKAENDDFRESCKQLVDKNQQLMKQLAEMTSRAEQNIAASRKAAESLTLLTERYTQVELENKKLTADVSRLSSDVIRANGAKTSSEGTSREVMARAERAEKEVEVLKAEMSKLRVATASKSSKEIKDLIESAKTMVRLGAMDATKAFELICNFKE